MIEPLFNDSEEFKLFLIRALNWYNANKKESDAAKYYQQYLVAHNLPSNTSLKKSSLTAGWLARILVLNKIDNPELHEYIINASITPVNNDAVNKVKTSVQDNIKSAARKIYAEINDYVELYIRSQEISFDLIKYLKESVKSQAVLTLVKACLEKDMTKFSEAFRGTDPQMVEAYSHISKDLLGSILTLYKSILSEIQDLDISLHTKAVLQRKPRTKKEPSAEKIIKKLKYLKSYNEYDSIDPILAIGSKVLYVYDTKTATVFRYLADNFRGLSFKNSSVDNFSEKESGKKKVRKPEEFLSQFKLAGIKTKAKLYADLTTKEQPASGRVNDNMLLFYAG